MGLVRAKLVRYQERRHDATLIMCIFATGEISPLEDSLITHARATAL